MYNKYKYKKAVQVLKTKYNLVDLIKVNEIIKLIERNNKNIDLIVIETPKTYKIEEV